VLVAPVVSFGYYPAFVRYPGSQHLRAETFMALLTDLLTGFVRQGARRLAVMLDWGRELTRDLAQAESREWLCTNGIGGFASGTVSGLLTRRYHGLLVAALKPPLGRTLLVAKLDETVEYDGLRRP
jgi:hypothetical protein